MNESLLKKAEFYLETLCNEFSERCVGSPGNQEATAWFETQLTSMDWRTGISEFEAMDWKNGGASMEVVSSGPGGNPPESFEVFVSPYSNGCVAITKLVAAASLEELKSIDAEGKILLLRGEIAKEQLMPKNFVFYNPEHHQEIIRLLEESGVLAIGCATGRNPELAGGVYPFPLIEDGDFDIPSVYMTEEEGRKLLAYVGETVNLVSESTRIPSKGFNVSGRKGAADLQRIVITAHIDAKYGTPGAIDNATGVAILLLSAELLQDYSGKYQIEIVALNGEDYYAVCGQMKYIAENRESFDSIHLNINIDGAGYKQGISAFSLFNLPASTEETVRNIIKESPEFMEGIQWPQGDHSIFVQFGRPAIAITSQWFLDNISSQDITHTPKDNLEVVEPRRLVEIAGAINQFIRKL